MSDDSLTLDDFYTLEPSAQYRPMTDRVDLMIKASRGQQRYVLARAEMVEVPPGEVPGVDPLSVSMHDAQRLMDDLWRAGLRPSDAIASTGQHEAQRQHIDDLRAVLFNQLGIDD